MRSDDSATSSHSSWVSGSGLRSACVASMKAPMSFHLAFASISPAPRGNACSTTRGAVGATAMVCSWWIARPLPASWPDSV